VTFINESQLVKVSTEHRNRHCCCNIAVSLIGPVVLSSEFARDRQLTTTSCLSRVEGSSCYGVYSSALLNSLTASLPPALTTLPLCSTVEVWPDRALLMLPVAIHVPVAGL
jgi:hypothetical protein